MRNYIRIGKIISLHGIKGEVKVYPLTDDIKRFNDLKKFYIIESDDADDSEFSKIVAYVSESTKYIKNTCILKIKGYDKIEESTNFVGKNIYVERKDAVKLNSNEHFIIDLIGIKCYVDNELIGEVKDIIKTKANSILVIDYKNKDLLVPMISDFIKLIDTENSVIKLSTIEGLIWK